MPPTYLIIDLWLREHPIGQLFYAPFDVVFSKFDVVEPDLLYMSNERALTPANVKGVPEIVIEIGSPSTRARDVLGTSLLPGLDIPLAQVFAA